MPKWRSFVPVVLAYLACAVVLASLSSAYEPIAVAGGSMAPALVSGDLVAVRKGVNAREQDIVLLRRPGHAAVLHRVRRIEIDGSLVTRGDANPIDDFEVATPAEVSGVVVAVVPLGRLIERWRGGGERDTLSAQSDTARR